MDPNAVVLEISSDEDVGWNDHNGRGTADGGDDHDWLAELLDEVNKGNIGDDSDEVVVVSEVSPSEKKGKKSKFKPSLLNFDDDCVILDKDPDKPVEIRNNNPTNSENDSDDIVVVSEKGQVACRDYPHPRHLCIKFPFSTTPNQTHCNQCYCYVCDSLAPCIYWGNGNSTTDHCHATDKDEIWKHQRKTAKNCTKPVPPQMPLFNVQKGSHPNPPTVQLPRPGSTYPRNFRPSNIISQHRRPVFPSRGKLHPDLFHQYMVARSKSRAHPSYSNSISTFKRTQTVPNRHHPYPPHRGNSVNSNRHAYSRQLQPNPINNNSVNVNQVINSSRFSNYTNPNFQSQPQFSNYVNPSILSQVYQTNPVPPTSQPTSYAPVHANPPSYHVPSPTTTNVDTTISVSDYTNLPDQGTQGKDNGLNLPTYESSGVVNVNVNESSSVPVGPGGLADYPYDWIFDNQPVEPGFIDGLGTYGPTDFSSDSSFIDTGPIFDF